MLDLGTRGSGGGTRRDFIRVGALTLTGLTLSDWLRMRQAKADSGDRPRARSVIQLWMDGGPTHNDTWDPKPESGEEYTGPYQDPIETNVSGIRIGQKLPELAKQADKYTIIRSMIHTSRAHERGTYMVQSGMPESERGHPSVGAIVGYKKGRANPDYDLALPPYVAVTRTQRRFAEGGFLGSRYEAFATGGRPDRDNFRVGGIVPPDGMTNERIDERRSLVDNIDTMRRHLDQERLSQAMDAHQQQAYEVILGEAREAFDLANESDEVRDRYGRNRFGQSCLLARRLVEAGVPFVTVWFPGWDTHSNHFQRSDRMLPVLDQGYAALLADLADRGLLDETIVVWCGEFGRTPRVDHGPRWNGGRHHWSDAFSAVVSGGGFRMGQVVGQTDAKAEQVRDRPVYPWDLAASIYHLLGIDPADYLPHPRGCRVPISPALSGDVPSGGLLSEIM